MRQRRREPIRPNASLGSAVWRRGCGPTPSLWTLATNLDFGEEHVASRNEVEVASFDSLPGDLPGPWKSKKQCPVCEASGPVINSLSDLEVQGEIATWDPRERH